MIRFLLLLFLLPLTANAQYDRSNWGYWTGSCPNTRNQVLARDAAKGSTLWKTQKHCIVSSGVWYGPYTGELYESPRGLDIDHLVPLKNAYNSGASQWTKAKKRTYFNDLSYPFHILAVQAGANRSKGAKGPDQWLPARGRCEYVKHWMIVKQRWDLSLTAAEAQSIIEVLLSCDR